MTPSIDNHPEFFKSEISQSDSSISVGGKVFLAGEYLAISGGPSLLMSIEPRFSLKVSAAKAPQNCPFHPASIAGKFWNEKEAHFQKYEIQFLDPFLGAGGFGASTAEFALLYSLCNRDQELDSNLLLREYRRLSFNPQSQNQASGADLIGQVHGGLVLFDRNRGEISKSVWPFADVGVLIAKTPTKLPTHEHLANLGQFPTENLHHAMLEVQWGLRQAKASGFVAGLRSFATELERLGLVIASTQKILASLHDPGLLIAKGCGALGADVLAVFYMRGTNSAYTLGRQLEESGCRVVATEQTLSAGLQDSLHGLVSGMESRDF